MELSPLSEALLFTGTLLLIVSVIFYRSPPKRINGLYGYRTYRAMQSPSAWNFAQRLSAILMLKVSALIIMAGLLSLIIDTHHWPGWAVTAVLLGLLFGGFAYLFYKVENALMAKF